MGITVPDLKCKPSGMSGPGAICSKISQHARRCPSTGTGACVL